MILMILYSYVVFACLATPTHKIMQRNLLCYAVGTSQPYACALIIVVHHTLHLESSPSMLGDRSYGSQCGIHRTCAVHTTSSSSRSRPARLCDTLHTRPGTAYCHFEGVDHACDSTSAVRVTEALHMHILMTYVYGPECETNHRAWVSTGMSPSS